MYKANPTVAQTVAANGLIDHYPLARRLRDRWDLRVAITNTENSSRHRHPLFFLPNPRIVAEAT